ncbi:hypothetical protein FQN53_004015 [Emmonsiellopsis sp. PD_33]|nr:hypothetical protein FQN53_004015 [Emmonsiellopsis sp. PD_33]
MATEYEDWLCKDTIKATADGARQEASRTQQEPAKPQTLLERKTVVINNLYARHRAFTTAVAAAPAALCSTRSPLIAHAQPEDHPPVLASRSSTAHSPMLDL